MILGRIFSVCQQSVSACTLRVLQVQQSGFHTSGVLDGWGRGKNTRIIFKPTTLRRRKLDNGEHSWTKKKWGKRLLCEMNERNLMISDPWVQNQLHLRNGHKPEWKRI